MNRITKLHELTLASAFALTACGAQPDTSEVSALRASWIAQYLDICDGNERCSQMPRREFRVREISGELNVNDPSIDGICYRNGTILISTTTGLSEVNEKAVLWHELAHCIHGIGHDEDSYLMAEIYHGLASESDLISELLTVFNSIQTMKGMK